MAGPTRLPLSEILAYATLQRWSAAKSADFLYYIDAMDFKYMEFVEAEQEKQRAEQEKKQKQQQQSAGSRRR